MARTPHAGSASGGAGFVWRDYLHANGFEAAPDECFVQVCVLLHPESYGLSSCLLGCALCHCSVNYTDGNFTLTHSHPYSDQHATSLPHSFPNFYPLGLTLTPLPTVTPTVTLTPPLPSLLQKQLDGLGSLHFSEGMYLEVEHNDSVYVGQVVEVQRHANGEVKVRLEKDG